MLSLGGKNLIHMKSTSVTSGDFSEQTISKTERVEIVCKAQYAKKQNEVVVSLRLILEKKRKNKSNWETERQIELNSESTNNLLEYIEKCKALIKENGFVFGEKSYHVISVDMYDLSSQNNKIDSIRKLIENLGNVPYEYLDEFVEIDNPVLDKLADLQTIAKRKKSLADFDELLGKDTNESEWQRFFETNSWIFGYGLSYHFLHLEHPQVLVGGKDMKNKDGQISDFLSSTTSNNVRYTVLVEIKTPKTKLLHNDEVRNRVYPPHHELSSAVAQVQSNAFTWQIDGSQDPNNKEILADLQTIYPRPILVIGNTNQLTSDKHKKSFEIYRRSLKDPEIITFDELRERAAYILNNETEVQKVKQWSNV